MPVRLLQSIIEVKKPTGSPQSYPPNKRQSATPLKIDAYSKEIKTNNSAGA